jgi:endo-1,4-beta-xylanase
VNTKSIVGLSVALLLVSALCGRTALAVNLLTNSDFEWGSARGWTCPGGVLTTIDGSADANSVHGGSYCALVSDRTDAKQGPTQPLLGVLKSGKTYRFSAWVKLQSGATDLATITVAQTDGAGVNVRNVARTAIYADRWTNVSGFFDLIVTGTLTALDVCIAGPQPGVNFYVDDIAAEEVSDWHAIVAERTEQIRKRQMTLTVLTPDGNAVGGATVHARQIKHQFAFGSCINTNVLSSKPYADFFRSHFEWAVCENESKWYSNEAQQGHVTYSSADNIYAWCNQNGITMRGHNLYWEVESNVQSWLKALSADQLLAAVQNRMESAIPHFKGKFVHWDINNEMVPGHYYKDHLGEAIRVWMFQRAHELDPNCVLFVNEYNVIENGGYLDKCMQLVQWLQSNGAPVQAVGAQCHFSSGFDRWAVINRFDKLATLGLPIWCTEFDMVASTDTLRANEIEDFYRIAFSHPAVQGILMWGFWQNSFWKANCYIVNANWTLNEAGRRYEALLKEWTTDTQDITDANGVMAFRGFHGKYEITVTPPAGPAVMASVDLPPGDQPASCILQLDVSGGVAVRETE